MWASGERTRAGSHAGVRAALSWQPKGVSVSLFSLISSSGVGLCSCMHAAGPSCTHMVSLFDWGLQGGCVLGEVHVVAITTTQMEVRQLKHPSTNDKTM